MFETTHGHGVYYEDCAACWAERQQPKGDTPDTEAKPEMALQLTLGLE